MEQALLVAQDYLHARGVTAWQDAILGDYGDAPNPGPIYLALAQSGQLTARVRGALWWARDRGLEQIDELEERTVAVYRAAEHFARERGIILADTKLEFGRSRHTDNIVLGDEVLTPDSSRFWAADQYEPGRAQASFDKQFVRDWLTNESGWNKNTQVAPPVLPASIVEATREKYIEAYERLSGEKF